VQIFRTGFQETVYPLGILSVTYFISSESGLI
jgi:hypothetical protein